ncbi:Uncharacterized protein APZ42_018737 [Daphnia magna]|uniref:Uncharacterized protein n=1 Tax=Daphnia magna TaxID=35525 RepID=A0A162CPT0_9CRUS|nr:Uncharacterized protein APZ42_018737 [Daphnia magna]
MCGGRERGEMANYLRECLVKSSGESLNNVHKSQWHHSRPNSL